MEQKSHGNILNAVIALLCVSAIFLIVCIAKRPRYTDSGNTEAYAEAYASAYVDTASDDEEAYAETAGTAAEETSTADDSTGEAETAALGKTSTRVNIRDNPSEDAKVLETVEAGFTFEIIEIMDNGWTHISYDGNDAYISSSYVILIQS